MASLRAHNGGVPFVMSEGPVGKVVVPEQLLSLRFGLRLGTIYVEEESFDEEGQLRESRFQDRESTAEGYVWNLSSGMFKVYGLSEAQMSGSTVILTPPTSTSTVRVPSLVPVKMEPTDSTVHILSDSDDDVEKEVRVGEVSVIRISPTAFLAA